MEIATIIYSKHPMGWTGGASEDTRCGDFYKLNESDLADVDF